MHLTGQRHLISTEMYDKYQFYVATQTHKEFICGQCKSVDYIEKEQIHFPCAQCQFDQCANCHGIWTPNHDAKACQFNKIEQAIKERFPACPAECQACKGTGLDPVEEGKKPEPCSTCTFSQCPGCKLPYLKNNHCDHVKCMNPECLTEFCFPCACLRSPTMEHCNQWHRRQCPHFPKDETPAQTLEIVKAEKIKAKCTECQRLGKRCNPPPDLARIRRFAQEEY